MSVVAIQGVRGSYSEEATLRIMGDDAEILECIDFAETFAAVNSKRAEFAVLPVRNKIVGEIETPLTLLRNSGLKVLDQLPLEVQHVLAGTKDSVFERLGSVRSHIEALKQCASFFAEHSHLTQLIGADTASSVRRIVQQDDPEIAAIGSRRAAEIYGAKILRENIADDIDNWTTFYLIGN